MKIPKLFWKEEAKEKAHAPIKNALLAAGETPTKKHPSKKKTKGKAKIEKVMHEFKEKELHSGSKKSPKVTNRKQAVAIALSESKKASKKKK